MAQTRDNKAVELVDETDGIATPPTATTLEPEHSPDSHTWNDKFWLFLYVLHMVVIVILFFALGIPAASKGGHDDTSVHDDDDRTEDVNIDADSFFGTIAATLVVAVCLSSIFVYVIGSHPHFAVQFSAITVIVATFVAFLIVGAETGNWGTSLLLFVIPSTILLLWYMCVRKRIPFAASVLSVACDVLSANRKLYALAFLGIISWTTSFFITVFAYGGLREKVDHAGIGVPFFFSFVWTTGVVANVVHTTIAGVVGSWWAIANPVDPVWKSLKRSCSTSFGSICFVSFLLALIRVARVLCAAAADNNHSAMGRGFLNCCSCLGRWIRDLFQYFSDYALVHVALYGKPFIPAAKDTWKMFKSRGWKTIINDSLVTVTLIFGSFAVGLLSMGIGVGIGATNAPKDGRTEYLILVGVISFLVGALLCQILSTVISAAVKCVFVCFGECPEGLRLTHPNSFATLLRGYVSSYPADMEASGYTEKYRSYLSSEEHPTSRASAPFM
eukprot:gb/GECG01014349.1/.p1 GENE.gb/GECG01014349.1/~~gb/GECG01014349.1/.p1  ORF type:complete len:501 (+),score=45.85 gb/GECG01014349.1/:1-1503(+)